MNKRVRNKRKAREPSVEYAQQENKVNQKKYKELFYSLSNKVMVHELLSITNSGSSYGNLSVDDLLYALENPKKNWNTLLDFSNVFNSRSTIFYRLNQLLSNMAIFSWGIDLYGVVNNSQVESVKNGYSKVAYKLESMNLKHEFSKIMKVLPYQDVYCGLVVEDGKNFFFQQIPIGFCKINKIQDGLFDFAIDLSAIPVGNIGAYPDYIKLAHENYQKEKNNLEYRYFSPPPDKQICIKLNQHLSYPYPLLVGMIPDIIDIDIYKKLKLQSARTDNYKAIMLKIPLDKNTVDKPLLSPEMISLFADINREGMTDDIGMIHALGDGAEAISFKNSSNTRNNVADATDDIYNTGGITKELFNGSSSGTAVGLSVENTSSFIYGVYRQFERWINRFLKCRGYNLDSYKYSFYLLDMTIFNKEKVISKYKDACVLGVTVVDKWLASLDMTPSRILNSSILHEDIYDFSNKFKPLVSAYNNSVQTGEVGRKSNEEKGESLSDSGEQTKDSDANIDR